MHGMLRNGQQRNVNQVSFPAEEKLKAATAAASKNSILAHE
jgi:hypothetical protein